MEGNVFERDSIFKVYLKLAVPVVVGMMITVVYNIADAYFVSAVGDTNLVAAVSLCGPIFTILMAMGNIFGQGGMSLVSRLLGQGDTEQIKRASSFCFYAALIVGAVFCAILLLFRDPILLLLGANEATIDYARDYYSILAIGGTFIVVSFVHMNLLRAEGMAAFVTVCTIAGTLVNIVLDPILISGFHMGAAGAAIATVIGYAFSVILLLGMVLKKSRIISVNPSLMKLPTASVISIFSVGLTAAISNFMSSLCQILTNQCLMPYGNESIAAMGISLRVSSIIMLVVVGLCFGAIPIIGYFYGAENYRKLKELLRTVLLTTGGVSVVMTVVLMLFAKPAIAIFLEDEVSLALGPNMLRWQVITMLLCGIITLFTVCFQAAGLAFEALLASLSRQGVIFIVVLYAANALLGYQGIIATQAIADVVSVIVIGAIFYKSIWKKFS